MPHSVDKQSNLVNVVELKVITILGGVENAKKNFFFWNFKFYKKIALWVSEVGIFETISLFRSGGEFLSPLCNALHSCFAL